MSWHRANRSGIPVGAALAILMAAVAVRAEIKPEHRKDAAQVAKDVAGVAALLRKKEFDEAERLLKEAEDKLKSIADSAGVKEDDRAFAGPLAAIARSRKALELAQARAEGKKPEAPKAVSFAREVAPIIDKNCVGCHGPDRASCKLRLDTFAYWRLGGQSGQVVMPGMARSSLLALRLVAQDPEQRMPKGRDALSADDIETIANWINQGAQFDGASETATMAEIAKIAELSKFNYPKPKGTETVSFTRDIAPWFANLCGGCHSSRRKSGGLSLNSYYDLMQGGDSGEVIIPGNREQSRLFRLVGGLELPRMPRGQARITRKNYDDLVKWFDEGNTFDGTDPTTPLATYVKSDVEATRETFNGMSAEERLKLRGEHTQEQWKKALPNEEMQQVDNPELLIVGNVSEDRLKEVNQWAILHLGVLRRTFRPADGSLWAGKLAVFVLKDRFSYDEFNLTIDGREAPKEMTGHAVVSPADEEAYVALLDVGDEVTAESPGLRVNLIDHLTGAFLKRDGKTPPDWLVRGTGLALAMKEVPANSYLKALPGQAAPLAASVTKPEDVFNDGTFSPATISSAGLSLVTFLVDAGGPVKFAQFVTAVRSGQSTADAVQAVYGADLATLSQAYFTALRRSR